MHWLGVRAFASSTYADAFARSHFGGRQTIPLLHCKSLRILIASMYLA